MPNITALHIYPIKGCAGIEVSGARLDAMGPIFDRRFMLVDAEGQFITQRTHPTLALVRPKLAPTSMTIEADGMAKLAVALSPQGGPRKRVQVWKSTLEAESAGSDAAEWFSELLQTPCELVRFADGVTRLVNPAYTSEERQVGFADAFPMLLISEASLADLNARLEKPVPMNRFRPNIVVAGTSAFQEDTWKTIRIGELLIDVVKPCDRCTVTTVDQATGQAHKEPLVTLAKFRRYEHKVYFGQNCLHRDFGMLRVGDSIEVVEAGQANPPLMAAG